MPLQIEIPSEVDETAQFKSYISQFHYLSFDRTVGENIKYIVKSNDGRVLACLLFGSAAWSCKDRDNYLGWDKELRKSSLNLLTANTRFLVFPWVRVPSLASHILAQIMRRISDDWDLRYGHKLLAVETYVDTSRFAGTCYRAANWKKVGSTTGRGRVGGHNHAVLPQKDIYLYILDRHGIKKLKSLS
jgi:hypothetical protein